MNQLVSIAGVHLDDLLPVDTLAKAHTKPAKTLDIKPITSFRGTRKQYISNCTLVHIYIERHRAAQRQEFLDLDLAT